MNIVFCHGYKMAIPLAPGCGLYLSRVLFDSYNNHCVSLGLHGLCGVICAQNNGIDNESNYESSNNSASISIKSVRSCNCFKYSSVASRNTNIET